MEAVINGCPAFAISQEYYEHPDFTLAAIAAATVARNILEHGLSRGELINVNVPAVTPRGVRGRSRSPAWAGGSTRTSSSSGSTRAASPITGSVGRRRRASPSRAPTSTPSSIAAIAVTPIHLDLTGRSLLGSGSGPGRGRPDEAAATDRELAPDRPEGEAEEAAHRR